MGRPYLYLIFFIHSFSQSGKSQDLCGFNHCDALEIKQHFEEFGFGSIDILFGEEIILLSDSIGFNNKSSSDFNYIIDFAKNLIKVKDEFINLEEVLASVHASDYILNSFGNKLVYITDNDYLCECHEETCSIIYEDFASKEIGFWFHLWRENPSATQGKLYYGANLGYSGNDFSPTSDEHFSYIESNLEEVIGDFDTYGYDTKESQVLSILSFSLLDLYDDNHSYTDAFDQDYQACDAGNCYGLLNEETYFLSPAGKPCNLQYNMKPNFGRRFAQSTLEGTLTGFHLTQDQQRVRGYHLPSDVGTFQGYRNTKTNEDYSDFYASSNETFKQVYTGFLSSGEDENFECNTLILAPGTVHGGSSNEFGSGTKISTFDEASYEFNTNSEAGIYENCIPKLSLEQLNSYHLNVKVLDDQSEITSIGVSFKMTHNGQDEVLHSYYNNDSPPSIEYLIWNQYSCSWSVFTPTESTKENLDFYFAVVLAFQEATYDALTSHNTWDLVAAVPGFGIPVDLANFVWYSIEDDKINSYLAIGGVVIDIKAVKVAGEYVVQFGAKVIKALSKKVNADPKALFLKRLMDQFSELYPNEDASEHATSFLKFYVTLDDAIILKFNSHPNLVKVWDEARKLGIDDINKKLLLQELVDHPNLIDLFTQSPSFVKAWDALFEFPLFRLNQDYLTYTDKYFNATNKTKEQFLANLDEYENAKSIFFDELDDTIASGTYANNPFPSGVWNENPFLRGREIEDALGHNLHDNFPKIDHWDDVNETITSIKSTDTFAKTYKFLENLESLWKKYIDDLADIPDPDIGLSYAGQTVIGYSNQVLHIAIPNPLDVNQNIVLQSIIEYAKGKGVDGRDIEIIIEIIE